MPENPIIAEIHEHREAVARECDHDPAKLLAYYRQREAERRDDHPLVAPVENPKACVVRENPPKPR